MAIALPVVAAFGIAAFSVAAVAVTSVPPSFNPFVPSCCAISMSVAPSRNVTAPAAVVVCTPN